MLYVHIVHMYYDNLCVVCVCVGGEVCRLVPALSLLKDAKMYREPRKEFYENVCVCFEPKEGASGKSV